MLINFRCKLSSSLKIQFVVFQCSVYHCTGVTVGDGYSLTNLRPPPKKEIFSSAVKDDLHQYMGKMTLLWGDIISLHYANVCRRKSEQEKNALVFFSSS